MTTIKTFLKLYIDSLYSTINNKKNKNTFCNTAQHKNRKNQNLRREYQEIPKPKTKNFC